MSQETSMKELALAKAATLFCQKACAAYPGSVIELIDQHYSDEDLTIEVQVPADMDIRHASDELLRMALEVEDQYGLTIITYAVRAKGAKG